MKKLLVLIVAIVVFMVPAAANAAHGGGHPVITSVEPADGAAAGEEVCLHGYNFQAILPPGGGASELKVHLLLANGGVNWFDWYSDWVISWSDTQICFTVPTNITGPQKIGILVSVTIYNSAPPYPYWILGEPSSMTVEAWATCSTPLDPFTYLGQHVDLNIERWTGSDITGAWGVLTEVSTDTSVFFSFTPASSHTLSILHGQSTNLRGDPIILYLDQGGAYDIEFYEGEYTYDIPTLGRLLAGLTVRLPSCYKFFLPMIFGG